MAAAGDLLPQREGIEPDGKPIPTVSGIDSFITERIDQQIHDYYWPRAARYRKLARRFRLAGEMLGVLALVLGAATVSFGARWIVEWVPVLTTVGASLTAFVAASRYDQQIVEFLRTAQQLEYLRDMCVETGMSDAEFIDACEGVISAENQGWMTIWIKPS